MPAGLAGPMHAALVRGMRVALWRESIRTNCLLERLACTYTLPCGSPECVVLFSCMPAQLLLCRKLGGCALLGSYYFVPPGPARVPRQHAT